MSAATFSKLARNIQRTGRYEPLVVRPHPGREGYFQIINGHHRREALKKLGYETVDAVVWDIDDEQAEILLATLNRLSGSDMLDKKLALLRNLAERMQPKELAKLLPQTAKQIERLTNLTLPVAPADVNSSAFAAPMVFFVNEAQKKVIEDALARAQETVQAQTRANQRAAALSAIAERFLGADNPA